MQPERSAPPAAGIPRPPQFRATAWLVAILASSSILPQRGIRAEPSGETQWRAGAATAVITPQTPMWMAGYAARRRPSEGKVHDLFAKALAVEDSAGSRLVIVTSDLISVPRPLRDWLEKSAREAFDLPAASLLINCSHTHCGPELRTTETSLDGLAPERVEQAKAYNARLRQVLLDLVGRAIGELAPARLAFCRARAGFAMNRRMPVEDGFRNFPNPAGPVDHDVPVLRVERPDGKLYALLFGYACHNTTLGFYQFCGDYAGFAQQYLQADHPGTTALFLMRCGGDQNPYPRRTLQLAQRHGRTLATAVEAALETRPRFLSGPLRTALDLATVEYATAPARAALMQLAESENQYDRAWGERLLNQLQRDGELLQRYRCPVQAAQFGDDLTLVALPGETVVDYSLRLKRELTSGVGEPPAVWVAGYSNDVFAYLPSRRVLEEGGYEAGGAMRYMTTLLQPGPFKPSVEQRIVDRVHDLVKRIRSK